MLRGVAGGHHHHMLAACVHHLSLNFLLLVSIVAMALSYIPHVGESGSPALLLVWCTNRLVVEEKQIS